MTSGGDFGARTVPAGAVAVEVADGQAWLIVGGPTMEVTVGLSAAACEELASQFRAAMDALRAQNARQWDGTRFDPVAAAGMAETRAGDGEGS